MFWADASLPYTHSRLRKRLVDKMLLAIPIFIIFIFILYLTSRYRQHEVHRQLRSTQLKGRRERQTPRVRLTHTSCGLVLPTPPATSAPGFPAGSRQSGQPPALTIRTVPAKTPAQASRNRQAPVSAYELKKLCRPCISAAIPRAQHGARCYSPMPHN